MNALFELGWLLVALLFCACVLVALFQWCLNQAQQFYLDLQGSAREAAVRKYGSELRLQAHWIGDVGDRQVVKAIAQHMLDSGSQYPRGDTLRDILGKARE